MIDEIKNLLEDMNVSEIAAHIENGDLSCWLTSWKLSLLNELETKKEEKEIYTGDIVENTRYDCKGMVLDYSIARCTWIVLTENGCVEEWAEDDLVVIRNTSKIKGLLDEIRQ